MQQLRWTTDLFANLLQTSSLSRVFTSLGRSSLEPINAETNLSSQNISVVKKILLIMMAALISSCLIISSHSVKKSGSEAWYIHKGVKGVTLNKCQDYKGPTWNWIFFSRALIEVFQKEEFSLSTTSSYLQLNICMPLAFKISSISRQKNIYSGIDWCLIWWGDWKIGSY